MRSTVGAGKPAPTLERISTLNLMPGCLLAPGFFMPANQPAEYSSTTASHRTRVGRTPPNNKKQGRSNDRHDPLSGSSWIHATLVSPSSIAPAFGRAVDQRLGAGEVALRPGGQWQECVARRVRVAGACAVPGVLVAVERRGPGFVSAS